jgi:hypothetical protein
MFERNRIDNTVQVSTVPAEVTLNGGEVIKGRFVINSARSIYEILNGETHFLDFETYTGERSLIARATINAVKLASVPAAFSLKNRIKDNEAFEPHAILGVETDASWDAVRAAYVKLSKTYHPDRFTGLELPPEVREYLSIMARRINAAYAALEAPVLAARRASINKAQPIYTSASKA